ncbi:5-formyltetrahydrofolate cyclo-ligase [Candidatus Babeliales bacterium]|nr:5-formyltetrahydrofolate cyclo-ligase [Candidatus Babeliales bacterium]
MKKRLRKNFLIKLKKLNNEHFKKTSNKINTKLFNIKIFQNSKNIGIYFSKDNEVDTKNIIIKLLKTNKKVFLPKIKNITLEFRKINNLKDLEIGMYKIKEPKKKCSIINEKNLDILILPCIAIDKHGNRIGRGCGYYDRFLNKNPNIKTICLAYDFQILNKIKSEKHDHKIDIIISEKRIIKTQDSILINGTKLAKNILFTLKEKIKKENIKAKLSVILVGNNPASLLYVTKKKTECIKLKINFELIKFKKNTIEKKIIEKIKLLNKDIKTTGILIQLPLPKNLSTTKILNTVSPEKDVDGLTKVNLENIYKQKTGFECCTPKGILTLLDKNKISLKNKNIVLVGNGQLVGKPLSIMLKNRNLKFKVCDKKTKDLKKETKKADILISATGCAHLIKKDFVKKGAIIIDAGTSRLKNKIVGDVKFDEVKQKASKITPVPGGVGPMTIASLMNNIIKAYKIQKN